MSTFKGKIIELTPVEKVGEKEYPKRLVIIEEQQGQYPQTAALELFGDKVDKFNMNEGDSGEFDYNISSREANGRWYVSLQLWRWKAEPEQKF